MGFSGSKTSLVLLLVLTITSVTKGDPLSSFLGNVCDEVQCGKGTCEAATGYPYGFRCICDTNWKRTRLDNENNWEFLPCIIPNCSVDYSCMPTPPPVPPIPYNTSFFDPCYWTYCGEGTCTKNSTYGHLCQCNSGASNLLNITVFPCYSECALGSDCSRLGINVSHSTSSPNNNVGSKATSFSPGKFPFMAILLILGAMQHLK